MRKTRKVVIVLATIFLFTMSLPVGAVRADSSFQIRLDQSIENAVFTLRYEGVVEGLSLVSPNGDEISAQYDPDIYRIEEGSIHVGVRTAVKGKWVIRITGEPEDGFQIVVASDSSYEGAFWEAPDSSSTTPSDSSEETKTNPIEETSTSFSDPAAQSNSEIVPDQGNSGPSESEAVKETTSGNKPLPQDTVQPENAPVSEDVNTETSAEGESADTNTDANTKETAAQGVPPYIRTEGMPSEPTGYPVEEAVWKSGESSTTDEIDSGIGASLSQDKTTAGGMNICTISLSKGIAVYLGVFLPVLLSIGVFLIELRAQKKTHIRNTSPQGKSRPSYLKRHSSKEEETHDGSLWRTSTWQAPSRQR